MQTGAALGGNIGGLQARVRDNAERQQHAISVQVENMEGLCVKAEAVRDRFRELLGTIGGHAEQGQAGLKDNTAPRPVIPTLMELAQLQARLNTALDALHNEADRLTALI